MKLPTILLVVGLIVLIIGRFHWLLREKNEQGGGYPTVYSFWLRLGSVIVFNVLWAIAAIIMAIRQH